MKNKKLVIAISEVIIFLVYAAYTISTYSGQEFYFDDADMQVMDVNRNTSYGSYLDTSYENAKAVVSPAFSLEGGGIPFYGFLPWERYYQSGINI